MATFSIHSYPFSFNLQILIFLFFTAKPISSFALQNNPNFDPYISLFGDARVENGSSNVILTRSHAPSSGLLLLDKPFKFVGEPVSFSTEFTFSLSPGNADGLALVFVPNGFQARFTSQGSFGLFGENMYLGIEFDTQKDDKVGDFNANHIGIDINSLESIKVSNLSSSSMVLNNGEPLKSWVDYDSSSKLLQVRLSTFDSKRPFSPILTYSIDLLEMWGTKDVFVGIISTSINGSSFSNVYSWRFRVRHVLNSMHSLPANPHKDSDGFRTGKNKFCAFTFLAGLIFGTGCGALFAFVVLFMWAILVSRHSVFPVECQVSPEDFRYEMVDVVVEKDNQFDKN
ncbi:hypothetical protein ERO13_D10G242200v2 [Gossypium hirsutum]|uniref:Lectin-like protein At1g53070 n=1 Tax=Gossypium hirsutum TaxID=3635 RepID=A0A1U8M9M7_GOSHI|nr:lectin-like protein At1g53070 [Gossypium hirsutum]KAG4127788.1 hypothetical protein ERO13_D10G242200v2 [Gossypium hirsutum]